MKKTSCHILFIVSVVFPSFIDLNYFHSALLTCAVLCIGVCVFLIVSLLFCIHVCVCLFVFSWNPFDALLQLLPVSVTFDLATTELMIFLHPLCLYRHMTWSTLLLLFRNANNYSTCNSDFYCDLHLMLPLDGTKVTEYFQFSQTWRLGRSAVGEPCCCYMHFGI